MRRVPQIVQQWVESISARDPRRMTAFYSQNALLLATYESLLVGRTEIYNYFVKFLDKKDLACKIIENYTQIDMARDTMVASGLYIFSFVDDKGIAQKVNARYTYVICGNRIMTHHSSEDPSK